jgi:hypothetical protein
MKDITKAENFKDLWENCISEKERQSIQLQTEKLKAKTTQKTLDKENK